MGSAIQRLLLVACALAVVGAGCTVTPVEQLPSRPSPTPTDQPTSTPVPAAPPEATADAFLRAWEVQDYGTMYALLSPRSRGYIGAGEFANRYRNALTTASVLTVTTALQSVLGGSDRATAAFHVKMETALFGTLGADVTMQLLPTGGSWGIDWDTSLIWPGLAGDKYFRTSYSIPVRANIYDSDGLGLATQGTIVTLGVIPGEIADEQALLQALSSITGLSAEAIRDRYESANPEWKVPIADVPAEVSVERNNVLASLEGLYREEKTGRMYPHGEAAPHVVGWVAPVPAEDLAEYRSRGYRGDEMVGIAGLEAWGEEILAGRHGGTLSIVTAAGEEVTQLRHSKAAPGRSIYTTLDRDFQEKAREILGGRTGSIVVLDAKSGAVRAMVSGPGFDPNIFVGPSGDAERSQVLGDPRHPLVNRALQGTYPTGSVFKIVTMSAGMEQAGMVPLETTFNCPGYWDGLGIGARKYCWKESGHGRIVLQDGLSASCNVVFYNVGKALHDLDPEILPRLGSGFGLGEPTGIESLVEEDGLMPSPEWKQEALGETWYPGDTVNLAIGQGYLRVTPMQVARIMAAVANGGTLYRPFVVGRLEASQEAPEVVTAPKAVGTLPISSENLAALQAGLLGVTTKSIGTASHRFEGLTIEVAGKTGTAEAGGVDAKPHSWFAAYAPADDPEIALAVVAENAGEGSTVAAPLARQVIEAYYGLPLTDLPPAAEEDYVPPTPTAEP
ncbi:MAG: penicillin-binding protein 2 [Anaerolineae bacterium]|jgi:penicillin-binding protein 2